jgi:adenylate cyclase
LEEERRLAAIFAADIAGFSRLTGADEEGTMQRLREFRANVIDPPIAAHRGRIVKEMGDGILVEFSSVVDAVRCSLEFQRNATARNAEIKPGKRFEFRIGIHVGDVLVQANGDLLGDTVNIASRLETLAQPGGICLSEDAYRQVRDRLKEKFVDLEEQQLKNIARPIRVYAIQAEASVSTLADKKVVPEKSPRSRKRPPRLPEPGPIRLLGPVQVHSPHLHVTLETVEKAINFIDRHVPPELAQLPRWTFARALLVEALKTGKTRDVKAATRQLLQALRNERWLDDRK